MFRKTFIFVFLVALLGASCVPPVSPNGSTTSTPAWNEVAPSVSRYDCPANACGSHLIMYRFDPKRFTFRFAERAEPLTVEGWTKAEPNAAFVANGMFFDEKLQPTGFMISDGKIAQDKKYDYDKSGLLELAPAPRIIDTSSEKFDLNAMTEAGQSFPLLIRNNEPIASFKDTNAARRTAIGTDKDGNIIFAFVPEDAITFVDFAKLLASSDVEWKNVLNLDGGTSTGFAARVGKRPETMNSLVQIPIAIIVEPK